MVLDYLTEDKLPDNQKFVCISFLSNNKESTLIGIKIRGVFSTYEDACIFSKNLQSVDPNFNVFVGDMGKWLSFDPDPDSIKNNEYENEKLNSMMKAYTENQDQAKLLHEKRKNEMMKENIVENLQTKTEYLNSLKTELDIIGETDNNRKKQIESSIESIEDQVKEMNKSKIDLELQIEDFSNKIKEYLSKSNSNII